MVLIVNADEDLPWIGLSHATTASSCLAPGLLDDDGHVLQLLLGPVQHGPGMDAMQVSASCCPCTVSPIVFYPTYNLWLSSSSQSYILFEVIAFQSGFFLAGAIHQGQAHRSRPQIPWTVNNSGARGVQQAKAVSNGPTVVS